MDAMLPRMMEAAGVTEELKARDPMHWVGLMNTLKAQAEEIVLTELQAEAATCGLCLFLHFRHIFCLVSFEQIKYNENIVGGANIDYMTIKEASEKWSVSSHQVNYYYVEGRSPDAI